MLPTISKLLYTDYTYTNSMCEGILKENKHLPLALFVRICVLCRFSHHEKLTSIVEG